MHTQRRRTYVVYRSSSGERPYQALGTVVTLTPHKAREIARRRWRISPSDAGFHVRAAGSVSVALLLEALALDGGGVSVARGDLARPPELPE